MNLEQYQLEFTASGGVETEAMRRFRQGDVLAGAWREQALRFERQVSAALAVPVPDDLVASLLALSGDPPGQPNPAGVAAGSPAPRRLRTDRRRWRLPVALAAGLGAVLALGLLLRPPGLGDLPGLAVAHVDAHASALLASGPVPLASLRQGFAGHGRQPQSVPAGLSFVSRCPLGDTATVHLVLHDGAGVPVTAYFLREPPARRARGFEHDGVVGNYLPLANGGAVLLVGGNPGAHAELADRLDRSLSSGGGAGVATR